VLPDNCAAEIDRAAWPVSALFSLLAEASGLPDDELFRTFNMGIGMVLVCAPGDEQAVREAIGEPVFPLGRLVAGPRNVSLA
jgi:phosphoribosylformylglycinamidine cyclo-ligase